jgi:aspartate aminotransferase
MADTASFMSRRARAVKPSATLTLTAKAKAMKAEGIDVIGFAAGEPDFDTPVHIKEAAKTALDEGFTKYTPTTGIPELKKAICRKFKDDNGLNYEPSQILVGCGAKHCIYTALQVLCDEGDEVVLPSPYWVSYSEQIAAAGAKAVIVETKEGDGFKITPDQLSKHITPRTKLLILNSPSNPTGSVYSKKELEAIAEVVLNKGVRVISDEIYEKIIYDVDHVSIASLGAEIRNMTLVVNGVSKTYSMTGWRIGYAAGPREIIDAMSNLQDHATSNPTSFAQKGAVAALCGSQDLAAQMVSEFRKRRDFMVERLNHIPGVSCLVPQGAFYVFPNVSELLRKSVKGRPIESSSRLAELLLEEAKVAVLPGGPFGADSYLRLSYAMSMRDIIEGLNRMDKWARSIQ